MTAHKDSRKQKPVKAMPPDRLIHWPMKVGVGLITGLLMLIPAILGIGFLSIRQFIHWLQDRKGKRRETSGAE